MSNVPSAIRPPMVNSFKKFGYPVLKQAIDSRARSSVSRLAGSLARAAKNEQVGVKIVWDSSSTAPTFGDYISAIVVVRLLASNGFRVALDVVKSEVPRWDWFSPGRPPHEELFRGWEELFYRLVPSELDAHFALHDSDSTFVGETARELTIKSDGRLGVARYCAGLVSILPGYDFIRDSSLLYLDTERNSGGFLAWHVRKSDHWVTRGARPQEVLEDYDRLAEIGMPIVLFSSPEGVEYVSDTLHERYGTDTPWGRSITPQKSTDFASAAVEVLSANAYFHRLAGGLGMMPVFSKIPYYMQDFRGGGWSQFRKNAATNRFHRWSTEDQYHVASRKRAIDQAGFLSFSKRVQTG